MLSRLIINNIALIDRLDIELNGGLNVLTGETGAGKSIIIDSVNLVLGDRGSRELISSDKQKARVEAFFELEPAHCEKSGLYEKLAELDIDVSDGELVIVREITAAGKSLCRLNGEIVTLAALRSITDSLVDVHGQHEHQSLLDAKKHISVLDAFRADGIAPVAAEVASLYAEHRRLEARLAAGFVSEAERERRLDILNYQISEIDAAAPQPGEEEAIEEELKILSNAEKINNALESGSMLVSGEGGALEGLSGAVHALSGIAELSPQYGELYSRLDSVYYELEDASYQLRELRFGYEYSPERLNELETRLDLLNSLKRKYCAGGERTVEAVLEFRENAQRELSELTGADELRESIRRELAAVDEKYFAAAKRLRREASGELEAGVMRELSELGMEKARFAVSFVEHEGEVRLGGLDEVEFMLSANAGEPMKPLSRVASGGELSRIMLAIKTVCADADGTPTLIFDEVDAGISGVTAVKVGERLSLVSNKKQVLSVTHLPQIAAFADTHLRVQKHFDESDGRTLTDVSLLDESERREELARIMGSALGASSDSALSYTGEMIASANEFKSRSGK